MKRDDEGFLPERKKIARLRRKFENLQKRIVKSR